jgi:hypothetical protein
METFNNRYTIALEHCGYDSPKYVLRFCDKMICIADIEQDACNYSHKYQELRMSAFNVECAHLIASHPVSPTGWDYV